MLKYHFLSVMMLVLLASASVQAVSLSNQLANVFVANTADDSKGCVLNRSPNPSDTSYVIVALDQGKTRVFLLNSSYPSYSGDCAKGIFCIELQNIDAALTKDQACVFPQVQASLPPSNPDSLGKRMLTRWESAKPDTANGPVPQVAAKTGRLFEIAKALQPEHREAKLIGDTAVLIGGSVKQPKVVLLSGNLISQELTVPPKVLDDMATALPSALSTINTKGIPISDLRGVGSDSRFFAIQGGVERFFGDTTSCGGACDNRKILPEAEVIQQAEQFYGQASRPQPLTTDQVIALRHALLLGDDSMLEKQGIHQTAPLLLLDWSTP